jgi:hypothetical protein
MNPHKNPSREVVLNVELRVVAKEEKDLPDGNEVAERVLDLLASNNGSLKVKSKVKGLWVASSILVHKRNTAPEVCDRIDEAVDAVQTDVGAGCDILQRLQVELDPVNHG